MSRQSKASRNQLALVHAGLAAALAEIEALREEVGRLRDVVMETLPAGARDKFMGEILEGRTPDIQRRIEEEED